MLLAHAFGNYRDLLLDVTLHPVMGVYLSHLNNDRADPASGRFPDENYAREIMQLFSIGLLRAERRRHAASRRHRPADPDLRQRRHHRAGEDLHRPRPRRPDGRLRPASVRVRPRPMRMYERVPRAGREAPARGLRHPGRPDRHAGRRGGDRQPVRPPQRRPVRRAPADPAPGHLEPEPRLHRARRGGVRQQRHDVRGDMQAVMRAILLDPEARDPASRPAGPPVRAAYRNPSFAMRAWRGRSRPGARPALLQLGTARGCLPHPARA